MVILTKTVLMDDQECGMMSQACILYDLWLKQDNSGKSL
jgi:hypothetical protein